MVKYKEILEEINKYQSGVTLLSVSKTKSLSLIKEAYNEGARLFGENHVQEIEEKFSIRFSGDIQVFMIGHLQSNKVKKAVSLCDRIESVDSLSLLKKINREAEKINKVIDILFEYNSSKDVNKTGILTQDEVYSLTEYSKELKNIRVRGLMTIGPLGGDKEKNKDAFKETYDIFTNMNKITKVDVLSMGMSGDWREAVDSGSTEVRIGSSIFGERI